jgi:hypothetical protein
LIDIESGPHLRAGSSSPEKNIVRNIHPRWVYKSTTPYSNGAAAPFFLPLAIAVALRLFQLPARNDNGSDPARAAADLRAGPARKSLLQHEMTAHAPRTRRRARAGPG